MPQTKKSFYSNATYTAVNFKPRGFLRATKIKHAFIFDKLSGKQIIPHSTASVHREHELTLRVQPHHIQMSTYTHVHTHTQPQSSQLL